MLRRTMIAVVLLWSYAASAQAPTPRPKFDAFEVATVKQVGPGLHAGRMFKMDGSHRWGATNFTLKSLTTLAYDLNPRTISGGAGWMESQSFLISAITPGNIQPTGLEQMQMLRALLVDRFQLKFHR